MWSKRRSSFLLIRCSLGGIKRFTIPIPLLVIDVTLDAIADLALVGDLFFRMWGKKFYRGTFCSGYSKTASFAPPLNILVRMSIEIINELRTYGQWQMVRVETEKASVDIDFW